MKRRIIITETDGRDLEIEQFVIEQSGDMHKEEFTFAQDIHHLFHRAMHQIKTETRKHLKEVKKKEAKKDKTK